MFIILSVFQKISLFMPYVRKRRYPSFRRGGRYTKFRRVGRFRSGVARRRYTGRMRVFKKRAATIIPKTLFTKLAFQQYGGMASGGAAAFYSTTFRFNGPYDPLAAAGGGSCTGFPQLAAIYGHHRVVASRITCWGYSTCATPFLFFICPRSSSGTLMSSATEILNKSLEYGKMIRSTKVIPYVNGNGLPKFYCSMYTTQKILEGPRAMVDNDFAAVTNTYPTYQNYWDLGIVSLDGVAVSITANVLVRITYYVKFDDIQVPYTA